MGAPQYEQAGADVSGSGTTNTIPKWTGATTLGDSALIDNGTAIYALGRNFGIGTASPASRLDVAGTITCDDAGTGLKLPATPGNADSQTLDCYQENTWTPTLTAFDGTAPTVTTAKYTRIGRVVYFEIYLTATGAANFGSTWGNTKISLPFTPSTSVAVPINRNSVSSCGATSGSDVFLTTYAQNAESMRVTGFFSV